MDRSSFLKTSILASTALAYSPLLFSKNKEDKLIKSFEISLSQWAFKDRIFGNSRDHYKWFKKTLHGTNPDAVLKGDMDPRDIVVQARKMGVNAVDLVNIMWFGHGSDTPWLNDFKQLAKRHKWRMGATAERRSSSGRGPEYCFFKRSSISTGQTSPEWKSMGIRYRPGSMERGHNTYYRSKHHRFRI